MKEVVVYQMGKVGSAALVKSINESPAEITAHHSHYLTPKTFHALVNRFSDPNMSDLELQHTIGQLRNNLLLHNKLKRYQMSPKLDAADLGFITLARHPLDWYFSNLKQNLKFFEENLINWLKFQGFKAEGNELTVEDFQKFMEVLFQTYLEVVDDMQADPMAQVVQASRKAAETQEGRRFRFIYGQVGTMMRAHYWFDEHFQPLFEMSIYDLPFDAKKGVAFGASRGCKILFLKFEQLTENEKTVGDFCGIDGFELKRHNESKDKSAASIIDEARKMAAIPTGFLDLFMSSRYARTFYPTPEAQ